jgi:MinD-like ATPase involved in chromosome partitioning or flagellar assembly
MPKVKDYYLILGVSRNASLEEIKAAHREKMQFYHPDRWRDDEVMLRKAEAEAKRINEAYSVLSNPRERAAYDRQAAYTADRKSYEEDRAEQQAAEAARRKAEQERLRQAAEAARRKAEEERIRRAAEAEAARRVEQERKRQEAAKVAARRQAARIISVHSYNYGTGKSTIMANLASQLAMKGKRVAMVDTDIQSPGLHVLFGLDETGMTHTLNDFLHGKCAIEEAAYLIGKLTDDTLGGSHLRGKNLWLVPSNPKTEEISEILRDGYDVNLLNKGLQNLRKKLELDYLFIDTHPGLNDETLLSIAISDALIITLRPDNQDLQGTAVTVDVARSLGIDSSGEGKLFLLINKALSKYDHAKMKQDAESLYNAPVLSVLPLAENVVNNVSGDIFSLRMPDDPWSKQLRTAVELLVAHL